ncbi:hypothetical protein VKT23_014293 [Stygiomarasmius scandens]|uniref:NADH:flavin oxidoreductase/NADH oxidase N-terminal domain-containing protein n=1 Tax=Marasmiellus scandens TaxID=2682957 RepID=A0ABR1J4J0_9AGAR
MSSQSNLFKPTKVGYLDLKHRIVLAPLTRFRNDKDFVLLDIAEEYYTQRASIPGTLLISEGIIVFPKGLANDHLPGIWKEEQIGKWRRVTDAVHSKGSFIYAQIWCGGRISEPSVLQSIDPTYSVTGPSSIQFSGADWPVRPLTREEIKETVEAWAEAAENAVFKAGFDGVELHFANGYLLDQFLQDVSNDRSDEYGGSVEGRTRFPLEVVEAAVKRVGDGKIGVRLSPWSDFQEMRMKDPKPTFAHLTRKLKELYPNIAYLSVVEPRIAGGQDVESVADPNESNDFLREIWAPKPFISAGAYTRESAMKRADEQGDLIAFGRYYISNPDLPFRLLNNIPLTKYDRSSFYLAGSTTPKGYTDYGFSDEYLKQEGAARAQIE